MESFCWFRAIRWKQASELASSEAVCIAISDVAPQMTIRFKSAVISNSPGARRKRRRLDRYEGQKLQLAGRKYGIATES